MNITTLKSITNPGKKTKPNEDAIIIRDNLYVVLDGATGLGERKIDSSDSDAQWLVNYVSKYFNENWTSQNSFIPTLKKAITKANLNFKKIASSSKEFRPFELPSAGVVALHIFSDHIKAYRIGDCSLYTREGSTFTDVFGDSPLQALDENSITKMNDALRKGFSYNQARESINDLLKKNRSKMNTKGGYTVLSINPNSVDGFETKKIFLSKEMKFLLMSDGFSAFKEKYGYSIDEFFQKVEQKSMEKMIRKLREIENSDKDLLKFPRLKRHDDATCIYLDIQYPQWF
jgi:serine/threonine protein phosphatase PrpC